jgi:hypothetical protein
VGVKAVVQEHSRQVAKKLDDWNVSEADMKLHLTVHAFNTPTKRTLYRVTIKEIDTFYVVLKRNY